MGSIQIALYLLSVWTLFAASSADDNSDALRECGNLHHLEFHLIPNAQAQYSNDNCALKCVVGGNMLSNDSLNEGFACPKNPNGICRKGECVVSASTPNEAIRECANLHHGITLNAVNSVGSLFSESKCSLKCVLNRAIISTNNMNEGFPCPENHSGVCQGGHCVISSSPHTTNAPPTTVAPTTVSHAGNGQIARIDLVIKLAEVHLRNYTDFSAAACIENGPINTHETHTQNCISAKCITDVVHKLAVQPSWSSDTIAEWNYHCSLTGPFDQSKYISIGLYDRKGGVYQNLGIYADRLGQILKVHSPWTEFAGEWSIIGGLYQVGVFHLKYNFVL